MKLISNTAMQFSGVITRNTLVICIGVACFAFVLYGRGNSTYEPNIQVSPNNLDVIATKVTPNIQQNVDEIVSDNSPTVPSSEYSGITADDLRAIDAKMKERGYVTPSDHYLYESYSDEILLSLAKNLDMLALDTLARKATDVSDYDKAIAYYWDAAAVGSTSALRDMSSLMMPDIGHYGEIGYGKDEILNAMATAQVASLRGDSHFAATSIRQQKLTYEKFFGKIQFSPEDLQRMNEMAKQKFELLQARRKELGFESFDRPASLVVVDQYGNTN